MKIAGNSDFTIEGLRFIKKATAAWTLAKDLKEDATLILTLHPERIAALTGFAQPLVAELHRVDADALAEVVADYAPSHALEKVARAIIEEIGYGAAFGEASDFDDDPLVFNTDDYAVVRAREA